jgi:hypothetical protein
MTEQHSKNSLSSCAEERPSNTVEEVTIARSHFGYYRTYIRVTEASIASAPETFRGPAVCGHDDFRRDSDLFGEGVRNPEAQRQIQAAMKRRFQTPEGELALPGMLGDLADGSNT